MFFRFVTQEQMDAVRAEMERKAARASAETVNHGLIMMVDKDGSIVIEKAGLVTVVGNDSKVDADSVERTMLESERFGWVPLYYHTDFAEFRDQPLEPNPEGFTVPYYFHPGHIEDVDVREAQ
jgi:hypothetical protein